MFKIGDKVRINDKYPERSRRGRIGTIKHITDNTNFFQLVQLDDNSAAYLDTSEMDLVVPMTNPLVEAKKLLVQLTKLLDEMDV